MECHVVGPESGSCHFHTAKIAQQVHGICCGRNRGDVTVVFEGGL